MPYYCKKIKLFSFCIIVIITFHNLQSLKAELYYSNYFQEDTTQESTTDTVYIEEIIYEYDTLVIKGDTIRQTQIIETPWKTKKNWWQIEGYTSMGYPFITFNANDAAYQETANMMNKEHKSLLTRSIGAMATYKHNNFSYHTGIASFQFRERFTYSINTFTFDTTGFDYDTTDIYYMDGNPVYIIDSVPLTETDTIPGSLSLNHTYNMIEIPVILGYWIENRKTSLCVKGGAILSISRNSNINDFTFEDNNLILPLIKEAGYFNTHLALYLGVQLNYRLTKNFNLSLEPWYRQNITRLQNKNTPIKRKYYGTGIKIGFSYKFR